MFSGGESIDEYVYQLKNLFELENKKKISDSTNKFQKNSLWLVNLPPPDVPPPDIRVYIIRPSFWRGTLEGG